MDHKDSAIAQEPAEAFAERLRPFANFVIALTGLAALGVLALAATRFHRELSAAQLGAYYVLPILWVLVSLTALRAGAEARLSFALIQISLGISLVFGEVGAALWLGSRTQAAAQPSVREEIKQLRAAGVDAYQVIVGNEIVNLSPTITAGNDTLRPITPGPGLATIRLCNEDRPTLTYQGDRFGFDNPDSAWNSSPESVTLVGDSYTVGVCVPSVEAIPGRLRNSHSVVNLGISGTGPLQQLALLREYGALVQSKQVVWIFYEGNDLWDLPREANREWLVQYLDASHSQSLRAHASEINVGFRRWIDSASQAAAAPVPPASMLTPRSILSLSSLRALLPVSIALPGSGADVGRLPEILARARDDVHGWGGELVVVYMPAYLRYRTVLGDPFPERAKVLDVLGDLGIRTVDLHEAFSATGNPKALWVTPRSHLTAEGYRLAADAIGRALAERVGKSTAPTRTTSP